MVKEINISGLRNFIVISNEKHFFLLEIRYLLELFRPTIWTNLRIQNEIQNTLQGKKLNYRHFSNLMRPLINAEKLF